jgi:hypothetical protein
VQAAGEAAAAIPHPQGAADGGGDGAGAAADVEDAGGAGRAGAGVGGGCARGHQGGVAGDAAKRFRGNARAVVQGGGHLAVGGEDILIQVQDHLVAVGGGAGGRAAGQEGLGQVNGAVGAGWRGVEGLRRFRGNVGGVPGGAAQAVPRLLDGLQDQGGLVG